MRKLLLAVLVLFYSNYTQATHLMGGEITWECIKSGPKSGQYVFQLKVYRDCQGVGLQGGPTLFLNTHNIPSISSIAVHEFSITDLSPDCDDAGPNNPFSCGGSNTWYTGNGPGAVEEHIYRSDTIRILGAPDANGWHFTWSDCCRNNSITNILNPGSTGFMLRAVMYPFTDSLGVTYPNNDDCYDSSPKFYEKPRTILEVGNGYDPSSLSNGFTYSHNAFDQEQDSITYEWGQPLDWNYYDYLNPNSDPVYFTSSYSYLNPINGITLNSITGRTSYPADQQGNFVTCTKVSAYKCGNLVSEIFREIQVVLIPPTCNLGDTTNGNLGADTLCNVRPYVQPPFYYAGTSNPYQWDTLVHCGDTVSFDFSANDNDIYPDGTPQDLLFEVSGGQFYNYNDGVPCQNPPCATFVEQNSGATPPFATPNGTGTGNFEWVTSCNHVINTCSGYSPSVYTFVVRVTDDFCPAPAIENTAQVISITVFPPCDLKGNLVVSDPTCGLDNGQVIFNPSGGVAPYNTYIFDMNGLPVNPNALYAGAYQIRITDSTYCEKVDTVVLVSPNVLSNTISSSPVSCNLGADGYALANVSGGISPYSYLWSNGSTDSLISALSAGTYIVSITDSTNCILNDTVVISEPSQISNVSFLTNNTCFGQSNGGISIAISGGTAPYTYLWSNGNSTAQVNSLSSGIYSVLVSDSNSCTYSETFQIIEPTELNSSYNSYSPSCFGFVNGSIDVFTYGGTAPYNYIWSGSNGFVSTDQNIDSLSSGIYSVIISDSNNCLSYDTILLTDPSPLLSVDSTSNVSCFGSSNASVTFSLSGGTPGYIVSAFGQTLPIPNPTSVTIPNSIPIPAGVYPYSITDFQGCVLLDTVIITQPPPLSNSSSIGYISCSGFNNGSISINPSGGIGPYTYLWNTGDTTQFLVNIPSGLYYVSILDSNNCLAIDTILMLQPNQLNDSSFVTKPTCFGYNDGSINLVVSGGTAPYSYLWSTGDTSQNLQSVNAGLYIVSVIDSNSCILFDTINVSQPNQITAIDSVNNVSCYGFSDGIISISAFGGTGSLEYLWSNGDSISNINNLLSSWYSVLIVDSNNCQFVDSFYVSEPTLLEDSVLIYSPSCNGYTNGNIYLYPYGSVPPYTFLWSNGDTTSMLENIIAGEYSVIITDQNNCILNDTIDINQPSILSYNSIVDSVSCYGYTDGDIDLSVNGGSPPYSYLWNTGDTTQDISNLTSAIYVVNVLDSNGCLFTANISVEEPDELFTFFNLNYVSCFGLSDGNIDGSTSGGTQPYSFSWNTGQNTEDLFNIPSDMYIVSVTDTNNCFFTDTIVVFEPDILEASLTINSGSLVSIGAGGTLPYTYEIYGPTGLFATTSNNMGVSFIINPVLAGTYTLVVTDANGCIDSSEVNIVASSVINLNSISDIEIFPNPSRDIFNLKFSSIKKQDINISIFSIIGEKVYEKLLKGYYGDFTTSFDLEYFGKSMYFLEIKTNQFIINKKLIVK